MLSGITVSDVNKEQRRVGVWFRNPEKDDRPRTYPHITIAFMGEEVASDREHRGLVPLYYKYLQDSPVDAPTGVLIANYPIPMNLSYEVTTFARTNTHHSQLIGILSQLEYLHPRFGTVRCPGGTVRRLERRSAVPAIGQDEEGKRIFRMVYRLVVPTELEEVVTPQSRVYQVALTLADKYSNTGDSTLRSSPRQDS